MTSTTEPSFYELGARAVRSAHDETDPYGFFDLFWEECMGARGTDYTDGLYGTADRRDKTLEQAQHDQRAWLLDQGKVGPGTRVLEIGCGWGNLLADARERGAVAVGVTPNPEQVRRVRRKGLDARHYRWQAAPADLDGRFDVVIANGSLEHYVSRDQAAAGQQEAIYTQFFQRCARWLDPESPNRRAVLTFITFERGQDPKTAGRPIHEYRRGSDDYYFTLIDRMYDGWYPQKREQVLRSAAPAFEPIVIEDGTRDYYLTSLEWSERGVRTLRSLRGLSVLARMVYWLATHDFPKERVLCFLDNAWRWQFEGPNPPCALSRVTLAARDPSSR